MKKTKNKNDKMHKFMIKYIDKFDKLINKHRKKKKSLTLVYML